MRRAPILIPVSSGLPPVLRALFIPSKRGRGSGSSIGLCAALRAISLAAPRCIVYLQRPERKIIVAPSIESARRRASDPLRPMRPKPQKIPLKELDPVQHATLRLYVNTLRNRSQGLWEVAEVLRGRRLLIARLTTPNGTRFPVVWRSRAQRWVARRRRRPPAR